MKQLYNQEIEMAVLGTFISYKDKRDYIHKIHEGLFAIELHQEIFKTIRELDTSNTEIDSFIVKEILDSKNIECSRDHIFAMLDAAQPGSITQHIKILNEKYQYRRIYEILDEGIKEVMNSIEDPNGFASTLAARLENTSDIVTTKNMTSKGVALRLIDEFDKVIPKEERERYYYGIPSLDKITGGLQRGEKTTIAARSGVGKTAFALQIAKNLSNRGVRTLFISREMSDLQVMKRLIVSYTGIDSIKLRNRDLNEYERREINRALSHISTKPLFIDDESQTISKIKYRLRQFKAEVLIVDYLQLITPETNETNREREVAKISRELKNISLNYNIPVIDLSQLNSENGDKRPKGERVMRESKAIYQDSNNVIYIHRPNGEEMKDILSDPKSLINTDGYEKLINKGSDLVEIILDKQRDGETGVFLQVYEKKRLTFMEVAK